MTDREVFINLLDGEFSHTHEWWTEAVKTVMAVYPHFNEHTSLKQTVPAWMAHRHVNASNALWDGNIALAKTWLLSNHDRLIVRKRPIKKLKKNDMVDTFVSVRARDKRTDWHTVK